MKRISPVSSGLGLYPIEVAVFMHKYVQRMYLREKKQSCNQWQMRFSPEWPASPPPVDRRQNHFCRSTYSDQSWDWEDILLTGLPVRRKSSCWGWGPPTQNSSNSHRFECEPETTCTPRSALLWKRQTLHNLEETMFEKGCSEHPNFDE